MYTATGAAPLALLRSVLPSHCVSVADADRLAVSTDMWPRSLLRMHLRKKAVLPAAVVWPETAAEVQAVVSLARRHGLSLVPFGAGSSVVGGATPDREQIVVDLKRLQKVVRIDPVARTVTAEAGIMGELLERQVQRAGFTLGHFPSSIYCSTLGGWLAARSAGQMSSRYGKIEDQVLGGVAVLGDGSLVEQTPAPGMTGPLWDLVGSEGTHGLWLQATLRLQPLAAARAWRAFDFPSLDQAVAAARGWLEAGLAPNVVRIYDPLDTFLHRGAHGVDTPHDRGPSWSAALGAHLPGLVSFVADHLGGLSRCIAGLEGTAASVAAELPVLLDVARQQGGIDRGAAPAETWYRKRYAVSYRMSNAFRAGVVADTMEVACPWSRLLPVYHAVRRAARGAGAQSLAHFSHVYREGGSIYFTFAMPTTHGEKAYDRLWDHALRAAVEQGANISHHHGVGQLKSRALRAAQGDGGASLTALRQRFDPDRVLNPSALSMDGPEEDLTMLRPPRPGPTEGGPALVACAPDEVVGALEQRLSREGRSLGPTAHLLGEMSLLEAARRDWLWRLNPQLFTVESGLAGLDARVGEHLQPFLLAPRAAQGAELLREHLHEALPGRHVERLWLRCAPVPQAWLTWRLSAAAALQLAPRLLQHSAARGVLAYLDIRTAEDGRLVVGMPQNEASRTLVLRACDELGEPFSRDGGWPDPVVPAEVADCTAGLWDGLQRLLPEVVRLGGRWILPCMDPAGAVGFLLAPPAQHAQLTAARLAAGVGPSAKRSAPAPLPPAPTSKPLEIAQPVAAAPAPLRLPGASVPLKNCTYCPKLCRFACPVATADGSETLTPRQLMLTAYLDRSGRRSLSADAARRLYSCVDCRGCNSFCEHGNDMATVLQQARTELHDAGAAPTLVTDLLSRFAEHGSLEAPLVQLPSGDPGARRGVFLSCQNTPEMAPSMAGAIALARRGGPVRVYNGNPRCCGQPLWRWGATDAFAVHARAMAAHLGDADSWWVDDPGCAYTFATLYPKVGVTLPPVHSITSLLTPADGAALTAGVAAGAPHDSCYSTRWLGEPSLRQLLPAAAQTVGSVLEGQAGCCGGMLLPHYDARLAERVARHRAEDLLGGGAQSIWVAAPTCSRRLRAVGAPVRDVLAGFAT